MELPTIQSVSCDGCGACCKQLVQPPFVFLAGFDDETQVPRELMRDILHFNRYVRDSQPEDTPCIWLDLETLRCRHYEHRPLICREFEMGAPDCLETRRDAGIKH